MDEILASIRRIIADEDGPDASPAGSAEVRSGGDDLRAFPIHPAVVPPAHPSLPPDAAFVREEPAARVPLRPVVPAREPYREPDVSVAPSRAADPVARRAAAAPRPKDLLAPEAEAAVVAAFDQLGSFVVPAQQRTVEDLMKEMLRPMLKSWLDENLPRLVEGLVRQEIERVTRARR